MSTTNQDFTMYAGDGGLVSFQCFSDKASTIPLPIGGGNVTEIVWTVQRNLDAGSPIVLTKKLSRSEITIVGDGSTGIFAISVTAGDTAALTEAYYHKAVITDQSGNPSTVGDGQWTVKPKPMATYSGDPSTSTRDLIRALVGDTDMDNPTYTDQVYDGLAANFGGPLYVAAQVCRMLGQKYAGKATKRLGDLSINYGEISKNFFNAAADYQAQADMHGGGMYTAGISKSDRHSYSPRFNRDAIGAFTTIKAFDNRGGSYGGFQNNNVPEDSA
jgi:hypothetical protein